MTLQPPPTFGFFEWNIPEDKIILCKHLSELLSFNTTSTIQSYDAWRRLTHHDDLAYVDALHKSAASEKICYITYEALKLCRNGKWRLFSVQAKQIEYAHNSNSLRIIGTCIDITHTKGINLSGKLDEINSKDVDTIISHCFSQIPASVAIFDTEMRHKFVSDAWKKENELDGSQDFIGKTYYEVYPKEEEIWRKAHQKALNGEIIKWSELQDDGYLQTSWSDGVYAPWYTLNGAIGGMIMLYNNITIRVETEKRLKSLNQELDRFAYVCSHDLKEPLRGISNFIQLLLKRNAVQFDEESLLYVRHALKGIERMDTLIKDILSYSEVIKQTKVQVDLNSIISDIKETYSYKILETGAHINVGILPTILGVPTQINQLFTNLISNAFKFSSEKPLCVNICAIEKENFWEFHVCDNGIGIPPEYHTSIFDMFKRLHSKNQYEGSGIGLATCKKIVNDHDGTIYVQSNPESGSDFVFTLPKMKV